MSADWEAVSRGISRGFERGVATGGRLSGLGQIISKIADRLKSQRETGEQLNLLGQTERIKNMYAPPKEWKPTTREEALEFEREKYKVDQPIVDTSGNIIGYRPRGAVFQPQANQLETIISALGTETLPALPPKKTLSEQPIVTSGQKNRVMVVSPEGKRGTIPADQLQEALKSGYKRALR